MYGSKVDKTKIRAENGGPSKSALTTRFGLLHHNGSSIYFLTPTLQNIVQFWCFLKQPTLYLFKYLMSVAQHPMPSLAKTDEILVL